MNIDDFVSEGIRIINEEIKTILAIAEEWVEPTPPLDGEELLEEFLKEMEDRK